MSAPASAKTVIDDTVSQDADVTVILYEEDSYGWMLQQVYWLRAGQRDALDLPHLAQVLANMAAQERTKLQAGLEQILEALLKWDHATDARSQAWCLTIQQQRRRITKQVRRQPSLPTLGSSIGEAYAVARESATRALGLDEDALPAASPYDWAAAMERPIAWIIGGDP